MKVVVWVKEFLVGHSHRIRRATIWGSHCIFKSATLASSFKYLGIIVISDLNCADHVNYTLRKAWKLLHFLTLILKKGNNNVRNCLAYTTLLRSIIKYGTLWWDPYRESLVSTLNRLQKRAAKFANNTNESDWETLAQRRTVAGLCEFFKAYIRRRAWKATGDRILKPCNLSSDDHNRKIRNRKQRTDVGKYSFLNRIINSWNQLPAGLLASFTV